MTEQRRWSDKDPILKEALELLRMQSHDTQEEVANEFLIKLQEERFRNEDGMIEDDYRIDFISEHLKWVHKALLEGSNVKGYHLWTFMDNWSWGNAYKNRYGFVSVNLDKDNERTVKKSGYWFKDVAANNGF